MTGKNVLRMMKNKHLITHCVPSLSRELAIAYAVRNLPSTPPRKSQQPHDRKPTKTTQFMQQPFILPSNTTRGNIFSRHWRPFAAYWLTSVVPALWCCWPERIHLTFSNIVLFLVYSTITCYVALGALREENAGFGMKALVLVVCPAVIGVMIGLAVWLTPLSSLFS